MKTKIRNEIRKPFHKLFTVRKELLSGKNLLLKICLNLHMNITTIYKLHKLEIVKKSKHCLAFFKLVQDEFKDYF